MTAATFKYLLSEGELLIDGHVIKSLDGGDWFAPIDLVGPGSLASLKNAFTRYAGTLDYERRSLNSWGIAQTSAILRLSSSSVEDFDEDYSLEESMSLNELNGEIVVDVVVSLHGTGLDEEDLAPFLQPLLSRARASILAVSVEGAGTQSYAIIRFRPSVRARNVYSAVNLAQNVRDLLEKVRDRDLSAASALDLARANRAELLVGLTESSWLEVKSQGYDLTGDAGRIELAQDVARFANGTCDGLLLIGLTAKVKKGVERVTSIHPSAVEHDVPRYFKAVDQKVFPPVQDLVIENLPVRTLDGRSGHILAILVPAQPEESKPFLVHGAVVNGKVEGAFISIVQRRGEHSVPVRAEAIHSTLAAGRALLRRGEIPPPAK